MALDVKETARGLKVAFRWLDATVDPPASLSAMEIAFITNLARMGTREHVRPLAVTAPKPPKPARAYERFFGVAVVESEQLSLTFSLEDARRPFLTANEAVWKAFESELRRSLAELDRSATLAERVHAALLESLPSGQASAERVARRLAMSKRTLQRRLNEENTTFLEILGSTRMQLANHYLANTPLSCTEISFLLGFADPNSFYRAFHEWTGDTPERTRRAVQSPS